MGILNFASTILQIAEPKGLWESLIFGIDKGIQNYALTIILVTLIIKVAMLPFDYFNRYFSKKNSSKMAVIQPEIDKLQKKFGNNRDMLNQKTMEVYKKHNYSVMGSCFIMLLNMAITMTIFFTLFNGLNQIAAYKTAFEFEQLRTTYETTVGGTLVEQVENSQSFIKLQLPSGEVVDISADLQAQANDAVINKYGEIKSGFLWIKNIWRPDTHASVTLSYKDYLSISKTNKEDLPQVVYEQILNPVQNSKEFSGWNGYYILIVLSFVVTYLSSQITIWIGRAKAKKQGKPYVDAMAQNKIMIYLLPAIMALFTLFYNAMFAIYIVAGAVFGLITNPIISLIIDSVYEKIEKKERDRVLNKVSYSRHNIKKDK